MAVNHSSIYRQNYSARERVNAKYEGHPENKFPTVRKQT